MKIKVIGWTHYDDPNYESSTINHAKHTAVIEEIRKHKYCFSGYSHQELFMCCPVFNDGKKGLWSQRGWGAIMAEAYNEDDLYSYMNYYMSFEGEEIPTNDPDDSLIEDVESLYETYILEVNDLETFKKFSTSRFIKIPKDEKYKYLSGGDTLIIKYKDQETKRILNWCSTKYDFKDLEEEILFINTNFKNLPREEANKKLKEIPIIHEIEFTL